MLALSRSPRLRRVVGIAGTVGGIQTQKLTGDCVDRVRSWCDLKLALSTLISLAGPRKTGEQSQCQLETSLRDKGIIVAIEESPCQMP